MPLFKINISSFKFFNLFLEFSNPSLEVFCKIFANKLNPLTISSIPSPTNLLPNICVSFAVFPSLLSSPAVPIPNFVKFIKNLNDSSFDSPKASFNFVNCFSFYRSEPKGHSFMLPIALKTFVYENISFC